MLENLWILLVRISHCSQNKPEQKNFNANNELSLWCEKKTFTFYRFVIVNMSSLSCRRFALTLSRSFSQPTSMFSTSRTACAQVSVQTDADGIATVSMNKAPVNSLNTEFIQELTQAVVDTEKTAKVNFPSFEQKQPDSRVWTSTSTNRLRNHKFCS